MDTTEKLEVAPSNDPKQALVDVKATTYDSMTAEGSKATVEDVIEKKFGQWGGSQRLIMRTWLDLFPIILFLYIISWENTKPSSEFFLRCQRFAWANQPMLRATCDVTFVAVANFATVSRLLAVMLVTWRLVRQKFFYVLLRHQIVISFNVGSKFGAAALLLQVVMFFLTIGHFWMYLYWGQTYSHEDPDGTRHFVSGDFIKKESISFFMQNPMALLEEQNQQLVKWGASVGAWFLAPAFCAMIFTLTLDDVEATLIPLTTWYRDCPHSAYRHLSDSTLVCEDVVRYILSAQHPNDETKSLPEVDAEEGNGKASLNKAQIFKADADACGSFKKAALQFHSLPQKIGMPVSMELAVAGGRNEIFLPPLSFGDIMKRHSYAYQILSFTLRDAASRGRTGFRNAWLLHCTLCCFLVAFELGLCVHWMTDMTERVTGLSSSHFVNGGWSTMILLDMAAVPTIAVCVMSLVFLAVTASMALRN